MKGELMLLGFISLLLTATSGVISNICIPKSFHESVFSPCTKFEVQDDTENNVSQGRKLLMAFALPHSFRRMLNELNNKSCREGHEPFVSSQGLKMLHYICYKSKQFWKSLCQRDAVTVLGFIVAVISFMLFQT